MKPRLNPRTLLPRGNALQRRILLAEVLGPPRGRAPWRSPAEPQPEEDKEEK